MRDVYVAVCYELLMLISSERVKHKMDNMKEMKKLICICNKCTWSP